MRAEPNTFLIGELAERAGVTPATIRYYESVGVIPAAGRSDAGYRIYRQEDVDRLAFVAQAQALGLKLDEIARIIAIVADGRDPCVHVRERLLARLGETRERIRHLERLENRLLDALARVDRDPAPEACRCRIIESGEAAGGSAERPDHRGLTERLPPVPSPRHGILRTVLPLLVLLPLLGGATVARAQALPFHTATGISAGFNENAARHFVSRLGRHGLVRRGSAIDDPMNRDIDVLAIVNGVIVGALTPLWTFRVIVPWIRKEMNFTAESGARARFEATGIGDALLQTKWVFHRSDGPGATTRAGLQVGVNVPTGSTDARLPNSRIAPRGVQVGSGTWDLRTKLIFTHVDGRWGVHGNLGGRAAGRDDAFVPGDALLYDVALGYRLLPRVYRSMNDHTLVAYLELTGDVAGQDRTGGASDPNSGGHVLQVAPALQWVPTPWFLVEGSVQIPAVQALNGAQLQHDVRFQVGTRYRFSIFR